MIKQIDQEFSVLLFVYNDLQYYITFEFIKMSVQKWKQIQRNLAQQQSFQREKKQRPQNNANIDNILSSSIQKAKQKINLIDSKPQPPRHDRSTDNLATSKQKREKGTEEGSAIAGAMKKLQQKITNLQKINKQLQSQNFQLKKQQQIQQQNAQQLKRILEQNKRKIKNLQSSIEKDKSWIRELEKKCEALEKQLINKKMSNQSEQLQSKLSTSQMMLRAQQQQFKNTIMDNQCKQKKIMQLQNRRRQEEIRYIEQLTLWKSINKQIELKLTVLEQKNKQKDILIESFKNQIKIMETDRLKQSNLSTYSRGQKQTDKEDKRQVQSRYLKNKQNETIQKDSQIIQNLRQKYQDLFQEYRKLQQKSRQDKESSKNYKNKFRQLKDAVKQLIQKIYELPSGIVGQLKLLIVKINKIQTFSIDYINKTPSKNSKTNRLLNNTSRSKSKSNSKRRQTQINLNLSNRSANSASRLSNTNRSVSSKKSTKNKEKKIIVSQKSIKKNEIVFLQEQIQEIRKKYKDLVLTQGKNNQVTQEMREQLNNLAILLQQRSQQLTKLKRKK